MNERQGADAIGQALPPVLNRAAAVQRMGGDEELYEEIFSLFLEDAPIQLDLLLDAFKREDRTVVHRQAHSLKSAAGNIGGERMSRACERFERAALSEPFPVLAELLRDIEQSLKQLVDPASR